ncbi:MAG TPA: tetratricopeptide repeat protein [Polyangium sp.]|nr:tetratricopeptide repeat protein [Polyangium sp.]
MNSNKTPQTSEDIEAWQLQVQLDQAIEGKQHELVIALAERLLELQDAKFGPNDEKCLLTLDRLLAGWIRLEQWEQAIAFLDRRFGGKNHRHVPVLLGAAARSLMNGEDESSEERALRALRIVRDVPGIDESLTATCHSILATLARKRGDWDHALMHAVEAFKLRSTHMLREPAMTYKDLILVAEIFIEVGDYEEACKSSRLAVELAAGSLDSDPLRMATALTVYGRAAMGDDKPEGAVNPFKGALGFYETLYGETDARLHDPILALANAYQAAEYFDEAEEMFQRLLRLYKAWYPDEPAAEALPLSHLGEIESQRKNHAGAAAYFEQALALGVAEFGEDSLRLHAMLDKTAQAHLDAENWERAEEVSRWQIRVMLPHLPSKDDPALLAPVRRLTDVEIHRLKEKRANEKELGELLQWVTRLMQMATDRLNAETAEIKARQKSQSEPS